MLAILLLGLLGTGAELVLLDHDETATQLVPLALIAAALILIVICLARQGRVAVRLFQATMVLFLASGVVGIALHYQGSVEFQREVAPEVAGFELFWKAVHAKAPPALAPGAMVQLGLLGLLYGFRHPALGARSEPVDRSAS